MHSSASIKLERLSQCPVCGEKSRHSLFPIKGSAVFECCSCRLKYLDPCLSLESMKSAYESEDTLTEFHDFHEGYYDYGDLKTETRTLSDFKRALKLLEGCVGGSSRSILDVGFGTGLFLALAKQRGWQIDGIDTSAENIKKAREKFGLELLQGDLLSYGPAKRYDAISFWDVIEHLPNPHRVLAHASHLLRDKGFLLIGIPNDRSFLAFVSLLLYRFSFGLFKKGAQTIYFLEHVAYYNRETLELLLQKSGFELRDFFQTSTDLDRFNLSTTDRMIAQGLLTAGKVLGRQNRMVAVFQKK